MLAFLQRFLPVPSSTRAARVSLTPGRLYASMSEEFRAQNAETQCGCVMPLPYTAQRVAPADCNWRLQPLWTGCPTCETALRDLFEKYSQRYDMRDPAGVETGSFVPVPALPPQSTERDVA